MTLRPHQERMLEICQEIKQGSQIKDIFCDIAPGGGKTGMAIIAFNELVGTVVDTCVVIVPRDSLKYQFEKDCVGAFYQGKVLRAADNSDDMARGADGYITTYQAIVANTQCHINELQGKSYMVILDELHHLKDESGFGESCYEIIRNAKITVQMSGTYEVQEGVIKTVPYLNGVPHKEDTDTVRWIEYSRKQALEDRSILPIDFHLYDCASDEFESIGFERENLNKALNSLFAKQIIQECVKDYMHTKKLFPFAKMIVIDSTIKNAEKTKQFLDTLGIKNVIATSENADCSDRINDFKKDIDVLCSVGVAYEGLDVPPITHVCLLTHIRSKSWIAQAIGRCQRRFQDKTQGVVFAPKDGFLLKVVKDIQREIINQSRERKERKKGKSYEKKDVQENEYFAFMTDKINISDFSISSLEKHYRTLINKRIEKYIYDKSIVVIQEKKERSKAMDMKRRKVIYKTIHLKIGCSSVSKMNVKQLEKTLKLLDVILR